LHPHYKLLKDIILVDANTLPHAETAQLVCGTILFKGDLIAGGPTTIGSDTISKIDF